MLRTDKYKNMSLQAGKVEFRHTFMRWMGVRSKWSKELKKLYEVRRS